MNDLKIKLMKSAFLDEAETRKKLADFILHTKSFSMGEECKKYEKNFAKKQGRKHAVFVNSGSSANLALIQALVNLDILKKGDKVGFSAVTWSTNVMPLIQLGLVPVAIDCEKENLNVSSKTLAPHIKNIKALFLTNVLGYCGDIKEIKRMCEEHGIVLFEDNCESLGSKAYNTPLGNFGLASTFSFYVGHHLSTLEGGMICTDNDDLYHMLLMVRSHGWGRHLPDEKHRSVMKEHNVDPFYALYTFYDLGFNLRPTEINGFLGNLQLEYWDKIVSARESNFASLHKHISTNKNLVSLAVSHMDTISSFAIPVLAKSSDICVQYKKKFNDNGVEIRPLISGDITQHPFYKKYVSEKSNCPNAQFVHENGFYFGNNSELTEEEVDFLGGLLREV